MQINESNVILFISAMAFIVSTVTEVLKTWKWLDSKVPTELMVTIASMILTPTGYVALMSYMKQPIEWFMVFASFIASFVVALIAMGGWEKVTSIIKKCMKDKA